MDYGLICCIVKEWDGAPYWKSSKECWICSWQNTGLTDEHLPWSHLHHGEQIWCEISHKEDTLNRGKPIRVCMNEQERIFYKRVWVNLTAAGVSFLWSRESAVTRVVNYSGEDNLGRRNENTGVTHITQLKTQQETTDKGFLRPIHFTLWRTQWEKVNNSIQEFVKNQLNIY